ncbi:hypothetical protein ETAR_31720 [Edwardsiella tarda]
MLFEKAWIQLQQTVAIEVNHGDSLTRLTGVAKHRAAAPRVIDPASSQRRRQGDSISVPRSAAASTDAPRDST